MLDIISMWVMEQDERNARGMFAFVLFLLMAFLWRAFIKPRVERWALVRRGIDVWFRFACISVIVASIAQALLYASHAAFFDTYEASVAAVSGLVGENVPLYHSIDAPLRYVQMGYGPMLYFIDYGFSRAFGLTMQAAKSASVASFILSLLLMARAFKRPSARFALLCPRGLAAAAALALALDFFGAQAFWTRGDPILVLSVVVGVWAIEERRLSAIGKTLVVGVALGVAVNLKFTGVVYFGPLVVVVASELGWLNVIVWFAVSVVVALLPFALPTVSLRIYLQWLALMKKQGYGDWGLRYWHLKRAFFWVTPLICAWASAAFLYLKRRRVVSVVIARMRLGRVRHLYFAAICVTFLALVFIASKPGATEHHFLPFFPVLIHAMYRMEPRDARAMDTRAMVGLAMGTVLFFTDFTASRMLWKRQWATRKTSLEIEAEVQTFIREHPGKTIEMGAGASLAPTYFRVLLVYAKMPYRIDVGTLMDLASIGQGEIPPALHERLTSCDSDYFLVQSASSPFRATGVYVGQPVYQESYRQDFVNAYARTEQLHYFDVWTCRRRLDE